MRTSHNVLVYILSLIQIIGFSQILLQLDDIRNNQFFSDSLIQLVKRDFEVPSGLQDLSYLNPENYSCFRTLHLDKFGKERPSDKCQCYYTERNIGRKPLRIPFEKTCSEIPKGWKLGGAFEK